MSMIANLERTARKRPMGQLTPNATECGAGLYPARRFTSDSGRLPTCPTVLAGCQVPGIVCGIELKHAPPGGACFSLPIFSRLLTVGPRKTFPSRDRQGAIGQVPVFPSRDRQGAIGQVPVFPSRDRQGAIGQVLS